MKLKISSNSKYFPLKPAFNTQYGEYLSNVFGYLGEEEIAQIFANTQILNFETGEFLFNQGQIQHALYIVLSGRFRVLFESEQATQILGDVSAGEPVGELGLFTKEPRSASVVALRKSVVMQLNEEDYLKLVEKYPSLAHTITQFVINRLRKNALQHGTSAPPKNIAIVNLQPDTNNISDWADSIKQTLGTMAVDTHIYYHDDLRSNDHIHDLFNTIENHKGLNLLVCDSKNISWANQCITYCDLVLVVTEFNAPSESYPIEEDLKLYTSNILNKKVYLILLHPENTTSPTNTRRWFPGRKFDLHLHIRTKNIRDTRRLCRVLTHQSIGLVLGGGGAKGFSHIGATKALIESGIEIDFIGGTSAGALFGIGLSFNEFDIPKTIAISKAGAASKPTSNDYHFPFLSLMTGRKMRKLLHQTFGDMHLEDIWIPSFCVSANYSTATLTVHETGLIRQRIEASIAIPGVFPPVIIDQHLHVDGGVMDNLPIEPMYKKPVKHIIAISLSLQSPHLVDIETVPSAWTLLVNKLTKRRRFKLPQMASILINSLTLNSVQKQARTKSMVSIYLEMDFKKIGLLDWSKWEELLEQGYIKMNQYLKDIPEGQQFWK
ncbi:MAG: patatin-like phospholipase family protein [Bacteroidetes Order II. Incertae sedis bacterium]|nr:patatin-like phospholipase family protein [Bacteroidetes Order II. bacterium]